MHRLLTFKRLSVIFLALFAVCVGAAFVYDWVVVRPGDRCVADGKWWDDEALICAQPISIAEITGRPLPGQRAAASNAKNRELIEIEARLAAATKARDVDTDRQRQVLAAEQQGQ